MKEEAQRIAIAEACGWTCVWPGERMGILSGYDPADGKEGVPPDYLNDLNACHEMEKTLLSQGEYVSELYKSAKKFHGCATEWTALAHASAAQRCEAFLKTIGKWEDGE